MTDSEFDKATIDSIMSKRYRVCANCGKTFYIPIYTSIDKWRYKLSPNVKKQGQQHIFCCSWSCYNAIKNRKINFE